MTSPNRTAGGPTLFSLFAGAGGLDIGLEDAGFSTLIANDVEAYACRTLEANRDRPPSGTIEFTEWFTSLIDQRCYAKASESELFELHQRISDHELPRPYLSDADVIEGDIRQVESRNLLARAAVGRGELFLVAGGPPCQPFSRAGKRQTVETATGRLFLDFVRGVDEVRPRWFLFENVKGLLLSRTDVLRVACRSCGASTLAPFDTRQLLVAEDGDVEAAASCLECDSQETTYKWDAQRGGSLEIVLAEFERIGYRCTWTVLNAADFGAPQLRERLVVVGSRDEEQFEWPAPTHGRPQDGALQIPLALDTHRTCDWTTMRDALWGEGHRRYGALGADAVLWVKNVVRPHDEPVTWSLDRPSPTVGAHQAAKLALAPFGVPEEQLRRQQWHTLGRRQGDSPPVQVEHAYLSDEELLRLQTFPPGWFLYGTRMERAFQVGNAVPPVLGRALGEAILRASGEEGRERSR